MATAVNPRPRAALTRHPRSPHTVFPRELKALWMLQQWISKHKQQGETSKRKRAIFKHKQAVTVFERARRNWIQILRERIQDGAILSKERFRWNEATGQVVDTRARRASTD